MSFFDKATIEGSQEYYKISTTARPYSFKDYGFKETKAGNFQLVRALDLNPRNTQSPKLKITIAKDLKTLKMSLTTANGLKALNIFKGANQEEKQKQFAYIMADLIEHGCLEKA
ncbi:cysteine desulfurase [Vagococcus penaei]|uniref:Cysteine desulfurase n=1 Tax=Vagococcus penaei TaxID=633807 RepID=A0A1Q2D8J9_9ENTE|nr:cysteine desulfurase [Vagococcus penaei]AQP54702.1 cysteine desulfurase [Vagococcus penaei]RSU05355.1 cysteine desulfurase [Vagococcus penaei]